MPTIQIGEAIKYGWHKFREHLGYVLMLMVALAVVHVALNVLMGGEEPRFQGVIAVVAAIVVMIISVIMEIGMTRATLDLIDTGKHHSVTVLFNQWGLFIKYLIGRILISLVVIVGLILLIIPGIYFALKYQFYGYLIVDKGLKPIEALKRSGELTQGVKWQLLGLLLVFIGINILGAMALLVGLLVTLPVTALAYAHVYRILSQRMEPVAAAAAPVTPAPAPAPVKVEAPTPAPAVPTPAPDVTVAPEAPAPVSAPDQK